jgi:amidohydrolase
MVSFEPEFKRWLSEVRRDLHMHPEVAYQEQRTTKTIMALLTEMGVENHGFEDMTGAVGLIRGGSPGPTMALRADIDALPITELNQVPYCSVHEGVMHACGHDANTAVVLGTAKHLLESGEMGRLKGQVKLLFQPAEEGGAGALKMIERGVLEDPHVDRVIGGHMGPDTPAGEVGIYRNQGYASADTFKLLIRGKGAHGGRPNQGNDPIVAGSYFVTALQTVVGRNVDPLDAAVITVGKFRAGSKENIIPEEALLEGTIRALTPEVRELVIGRMNQISAGLAATFGLESELTVIDGYPPCVNDEEVSLFLHQAASDVLGPDKVSFLNPTTGAEDFAFFAQERPASIIRIGSGNPEKGITALLHTPYFDIDEEALSVGVAVFSEAVRRFLS